MDSGNLVLLSGGPDSSTALLHLLKAGKQVHAVSFFSDFRGANAQELNCARRLAERYNVSHDIIDFSFTHPLYDVNPRMKFALGGATDCLPADWVTAPLSVELMQISAACYGLARGIHTCTWAIHLGDLNDSSVAAMRNYTTLLEELIRLRTGTDYSIETPFIEMEKQEVLRLGIELGLDLTETFSCFDETSNGGTCGQCYKCVERNAAQKALDTGMQRITIP